MGAELYLLLLGQYSPTAGQVAHWVSLVSTQGLDVSATQFYDSAGARAHRVVLLYARMLRRAPSGASLTHWVEADRAGEAAVAVPLAGSAEYLTVAQTRHDARLTSPLSATVHLWVSASIPITPVSYTGHLALAVLGTPPGLPWTVSTGLVGTPTLEGTYHTYVILMDGPDLVVDTLTVTELA